MSVCELVSGWVCLCVGVCGWVGVLVRLTYVRLLGV